jgi:tellurite resistance protein
MSKKTPAEAKLSLAELESYASRIRTELKVPKQNDVFRVAVEAGYLTALADGTVDPAETTTMVRAIEMLSEGAVIEWETEELLSQCADRAKKDGASTRAESTGKELAALGHAEVGLLFAALVAGASKGIDKKEAEMLKTVGAAAGLAGDAVKDIVKRANAMRQAGSDHPPA